MRKLTAILLLLSVCACGYARHIKGGEITYTYLGPGSSPNSDRYELTLRLFLECNASGQQLDEFVNIGIFRNADQAPVAGSPFNFPLTEDQFIRLTSPNVCIHNPSPVCYRLRTYRGVIELPKTEEGYMAIFQRCCRIDNLANLSPSSNIGSSYTCIIHGTKNIGINGVNSSPSFSVKDTVLICRNRPFELDFGANDPDGDLLTYEFCDAYSAPSGGGQAGGVINPSSPSQLSFVNYASSYSGSQPLGPKVTINSHTGLITGIAPEGGDYVISVCVHEWRNGKLVSEHRKDFNIRVDDRCDLAAAALKPVYSTCDDFSQFFQNEAPISILTHSYFWDFGVRNAGTDTTSQPTPTFTYPDTGVYKLKLIINRGEQCSDSATAIINVFPYFKAGFDPIGSCLQNPYLFKDTTKATYGAITDWRWDFGDESSAADTSHKTSPTWKYTTTGTKHVQLIVQSSKGCIDTANTTLSVLDKPPISLPFRDTLICSIDTLRLQAGGNGIFSWGPLVNMYDQNTNAPFVYPKTTTVYTVTLDAGGCVNTANVRVRVVDSVTLKASPDSTICLTDPVQLRVQSDGLKFTWAPAASLNNASLKTPTATPSDTTKYIVLGEIGKCRKLDSLTIATVPYPFVQAGVDTIICYHDTAVLHGVTQAPSFAWSPANSLSNARSLHPLAHPLQTQTYTLTVIDPASGCPKPNRDMVLVTMRDKINAFAGNDTAVVLEQSLQMNGSGAELFEWSPPVYLSDDKISNPIAVLSNDMTYVLKAFTSEGCAAYDTINIRVFKTRPDIFVPNAFTPGRATNNVLKPVAAGISQLQYFRVYNRWGQLMFQTREPNKGWDGTVGGSPQAMGTYVWMVQGMDFTGRMIFHKGTALLIR